MALLISSNIGLRGSEISNSENEVSESVKQVRRNIWDMIMGIRYEYNIRPAIMALQEDGGYGWEPEPFFEAPIAHDYDITVGEQGKGKNGVSTYSTLESAAAFNPVDAKNEIVTITFKYKRKDHREVRAAHINVYRNIHSLHERSLDDTVTALKKTIKKLRTDESINKVIISGDFNSEDFIDLGPTFREINDARLFHQHNANTAKRKIDRVFVNFNDVGILDIKPTMENKVVGNEDNSLGHKTIVLWIGFSPNRTETATVKKIDLRKLKDSIRGRELKFIDVDINEDDFDRLGNVTPETFDNIVDDFYTVTQKLVLEASVSKKVRLSGPEKILLNGIEHAEQAILTGKKASETLYKAVNTIRKGLEDTSNKTRPPIEKLGEKLEKKISKLNKTDLVLGKKVVEELFDVGIGIECKKFKDVDHAKSIFMSCSNSGAMDESGISLKVTKTLLGHNRHILRRFKLIVDLTLNLGIFPKKWTKDVINFIFKNKGDRDDPANWRPITIAPSFGKHIEKAIAYIISGLDDKNPQNHAYKSKHAVMTAITHAQEALTNHLIEARKKCPKNKKIVSFITADDIAGAFESVDHTLIGYALELIFKQERKFKIRSVIESYLQRQSTVIDRDSNDTYSIAKKFKDRSIPQGSILSPLLWRIYDSIFSRLYENTFSQIIECDDSITQISHLSYADDHLTIFTMLFDIKDTPIQIGMMAADVFDLLRINLKAATSQMGCDINPLKSESVVESIYAPFIDLTMKTEKAPSNDFKWLGYFLILGEDHQLIFDEKKINDRIKSIYKFRDVAFRYTSNIVIRWKVYKVFIAPFIELYIPIVLQHKTFHVGIVHDLQHTSMVRALGLPRTTGRATIEKKLGEKSIEEKTKRLANRMITTLDIKQPEFDGETLKINLRSGTTTSHPTKADDRKNFIARLFVFNDLDIAEPVQPVKFVPSTVRRWAHDVRISINNRISAQQRAASS